MLHNIIIRIHKKRNYAQFDRDEKVWKVLRMP